MEQGSRLRYGPKKRNAAWIWGEGPIVVFVHGWNGSAVQLAPLAQRIAGRGFRCVAIDVTGHGGSQGNRTGWRHFIDDVAALTEALGTAVYAYVGHSAGGLTLMAARAIRGIRAEKYVCVCTPSHPFPPIRAVKGNLDPPPRTLGAYQDFIASQFDSTWQELTEGRAFLGANADLLLFYDQTDRFVDHTEGDRIKSWCSGAQLTKTSGYGHMKVLGAPELEQSIAGFLLGTGVNSD